MAPSRKLAELYYEISARTDQLPQQLGAAERSFGKLTNFILKNPVQATLALGTAMLGVAIRAQRMAEEVDKHMRRVQAATNGTAEGMKALRSEIEAMSRATGRSQAELAQAAVQASKSVGTTEEVAQRLNAALMVSQVTGAELATVLDGLDQVMDTFGIATDRSAETLANLYAIAKGRLPLEDLFATLQAAAPALRQLGVDMDTAARALAALQDQGLSAKQAAKELKALSELGADGAKRIQELAESVVVSRNALAELRAEEERVNNETDNLIKRLGAGLGAAFVELGRKLNTVVNPFLRANVQLLEILTGRAKAAADAQRQLDNALKTGSSNPITITAQGGLTAEDIRKQQEARKKAADAAKKAADELKRIRERQLKDELDAVHKALDAQVDARKNANTRIYNAQRESGKRLAELAGDTVKVLETEIADTVEEFKKRGASDEEIKRIIAHLQVALESAKALKGAVGRIELPKSIAKDLADNADALKEAARQAAEYERQMREAHEATVRTADAIADIGNAVLSVAGALGIVSQEVQNIGRGAINVGTGIIKGNALQVAAGLGDIITGITAGNRERAQQHKEALARLEDIKKNTGDLVGRDVTGNRLSRTRVAVSEVVGAARTVGGNPSVFIGEMQEILRRLGLTFEDVQAVAAEFDITLGRNEQSWKDLKAVLDAIDLKAFTDTFEGMIDIAAQARRIFGNQSPLSELLDAARILGKFSPEFAKIFEGLDLTKAEDRAIALERIFETFNRALSGDIDLGDLTLDQFLDWLGDIGDLIRELAPEIKAFDKLDESANKATKAVLSFADALAQAFQDIDLDALIFGESSQDTFNKKFQRIIAGLPAPEGTGGFTPAGEFDLSTQAGRDEARAALQQLAISNPELKPLIADLIRDLDNLPELVGEEVGAAVGSALKDTGTSVSGSIQQLTIFQGDRLITLGETQLLRQTQIRDLIAGAVATRTQVLQPPPLGASFGATTFGGGTVQQGSLYANITVNVPQGVTEPATIANLTVDRLLADAMVRARFLSGSNRAV